MMDWDRPFNKPGGGPAVMVGAEVSTRRSFLHRAALPLMAAGCRPLVGAAAAAPVLGPVLGPAGAAVGVGVAAEVKRDSRGYPTVAEIRSRSPDLWKLVDLINDYRRRHRLPAIALSSRLTAVAALHARDLAHREPHKTHGSLHSWSRDERWTGGGYNSKDKKTWPLMWDKPKEITGYKGYGFEVAAAQVKDVQHALEEWKKSHSHNIVILNRGVWAEARWQWKAVGAVFYQGYACAWFGDKPDT